MKKKVFRERRNEETIVVVGEEKPVIEPYDSKEEIPLEELLEHQEIKKKATKKKGK
jgi:hypothetical protein